MEQMVAGPGQYAVSALINGRAVGLHHFRVEAGARAPDQDDHDEHDDQDTPDTSLATELSPSQATGGRRQLCWVKRCRPELLGRMA
jgi:hypothetical protein